MSNKPNAIVTERVTANVTEDEFVIFLIGMRINKLWKVHQWWPVSNGEVGIWHETFRVHAGDFECVYNNMPGFGLAQAYGSIPATGDHARAASRMKSRAAA
ncbi:MAG: DUF4188 domain-containing protein [Gammaproteobacteria bacterium]|nr:MAG: DUF4188 domain-containing protein [Gammaproteobacteria bacterium]